ncbi:MAG: periplasmic heavy metal sensor [Candidatus Neomarinimicrobiota bacterium]
MSKRMPSWMIPVITLGALVLMANSADAQEGTMKGTHEQGMMSHTSMKGEKHQTGMGHKYMMRQKHHGGDKFFLGMKDELGLTDEQVSKLRALKSETEKRMIRTKADLGILEIELHDLLREDKVNVKTVDSKIEKIGELRTKMQKAHVHAGLDARKMLTSEQLKKLHGHKGKGM